MNQSPPPTGGRFKGVRYFNGGLFADASIYCEMPHGGWCPKGRKAEDGGIPEKYQLTEMETGDYLARTEANVVDSDATVVFTLGRPTGGSLRTIEFARGRDKTATDSEITSHFD